MIDATLEVALRESTAEILEKMFFICDTADLLPNTGEPLPEDDDGTPEIAVRLTFEGSPPGWLALRISKMAARSIAADFLGGEADTLTDQQAEEMACELANMICGSVLSRTGSGATFHLSSPAVVPPAAWLEPEDATVHRVALAGSGLGGSGSGRGALTIFMKAEIPICRSNEEFAS
jgi:CheY-specific phosphatase CheX